MPLPQLVDVLASESLERERRVEAVDAMHDMARAAESAGDRVALRRNGPRGGVL